MPSISSSYFSPIGALEVGHGRLLYILQFGEIAPRRSFITPFFGPAVDAAGVGRPMAAHAAELPRRVTVYSVRKMNSADGTP
jgi:hypothetical protein